jgi:hypothetical protein
MARSRARLRSGYSARTGARGVQRAVSTYQQVGSTTRQQTSGNAGRENLIVLGALLSVAVVGWDLHSTQANRQQAIKTLGAVVVLWGLVFVLGEFSPQLGAASGVFLLLVFLVARGGVVSSIFKTVAPSTAQAPGRGATGGQIAPNTGG